MKVLWVSEARDRPGGGGASENILINYLKSQSFDVDRIVMDELELGIERNFPWEVQMITKGRMMGRKVSKVSSNYDVVICQGNAYPWVVDGSNVPVIVFIRDHFYRCPNALHNPCNGKGCWWCVPPGQKIVYPLVKYLIRKKLAGLKKADLVLTNSHYMMIEIMKRVPLNDIDVAYPPIVNSELIDGPHDRIIFLGMGPWKGSELVLRLARWHPEFNFIIAGDRWTVNKYKDDNIPNVEFHHWLENTEAFSQAKLVLMPSQWPEPFGRIPIEAGIQGIPTLASNIGGLPESVGDPEMLIPHDDSLAWSKSLIELVNDNDSLEYHGQIAKENANNFLIEKIGPKFISQIGGLNESDQY